MKISPLPSTGMTVGAVSMDAQESQVPVPTTRKMKMATNATPKPYDPNAPVAQVEDKPAARVSAEEPAKTVDEESQPISPKFAELARQRRELQKQRQEFERAKAEFDAQKGTQGPAIDLAKVKADPIGVMLESGVTYDQLAEEVIKRQQAGFNPEVVKLKEEIKSMNETIEKKFAEKEETHLESLRSQIGHDVSSFVAKSDEFEAIRDEKASPKVVEYMMALYRKHGGFPSLEEACSAVNEWLVEDAVRKSKWKQVQSKIAPSPAPAPLQNQRPQMKTLTNRDTASIPTGRRERAMAAFYGTLKK